MPKKLAVSLFLFCLVVALLHGSVCAADAISTIDYPDAVFTIANGINSQGDIVGWYTDVAGKTHGFFFGRHGFVSIDYPQATYTDTWAVNPAGDMAGSYLDSNNVQHGYLLRNGTFTPIDVPGATFTAAFGINSEGDIVGHYGVPPTGKMSGFLLRNGTFETYDFAPPNSKFMTCGMGINPEGQIVGHYADTEGIHGFLLKDGILSSINFPSANTQAYGIDSNDRIVGFFQEKATGRVHGFVLDRNGAVTQIDIPGALNNAVRRSNARGDLVGSYVGADLKVHGFLIRH